MAAQIRNIHDAFFKQGLSNPALAGIFLHEHLPPEVVDLLGPEAPELIPGSYVDESLRQHHSDLLFRLRLKADGNAFAYILMEHKSSPDPGARLQLLRYVVHFLTDWYEQNKQRLPLPPVLPFLAHQGPEGWDISCEFSDLFGSPPEALRPYLPSFRHALLDLGSVDDRALSHEAELRAFLKALKYCRHPDLPAHLDIVFAEAAEISGQLLSAIVTYLDKSPILTNREFMRKSLARLSPHQQEPVMGWLTQPFYDDGFAAGKAESAARILIRLLEKRFGALPETVRERIIAADNTSIETWTDRVIDAPDLKSIFDTN